MKKVISFAAVLILAASVFASCGAKMTNEEAIEIAAPLIADSYEINEILFGKGLPIKTIGAEAGDNTVYDVKPVKYYPVDSDVYHSTDDIREAALKVYTESYLEGVFVNVFTGMTDSDGSIYQYARYIDTLAGGLSVRSDVETENILSGRTYDVTTLKITGQSRNYVYFTVKSYVDGEEAGDIALSIKDEGDGWRLDSPTY